MLTRENIRRGMGLTDGFVTVLGMGPVSAEVVAPSTIDRAHGPKRWQRASNTSGSFRECCAGVLRSPTRYRPRYAVPSASITLDGSTFRPVARLRRCGRPLSVHRRSIARCFSHDDVQQDRAGVRANGTRQIAARTVVRKWAFAGHRGSGYLTPSEMHARLTRGSRRCLNGWQTT